MPASTKQDLVHTPFHGKICTDPNKKTSLLFQWVNIQRKIGNGLVCNFFPSFGKLPSTKWKIITYILRREV